MNLIVDINNAFYKSYSVYQNMYHKNDKDFVIKEKLLFNKFITDFYYMCRIFQQNNLLKKVICCYDSKVSFRKILHPSYKSNRTKKGESFYNVLEYSKKYFNEKGFIVTCINQLEADDCIGIWVNHLKNEINCIISADEDCRQLINENTFIYNNQSHDKRFYFNDLNIDFNYYKFLNAKKFEENPHWILFKKMILGCDGDVVPKLLKGRIGEKKLRAVFNKLEFDKQHIGNDELAYISNLLNSTFKDENILHSELDANLALVNLCTDVYHSQLIKQEAAYQLESRFVYSGNYEVD